MPLDTLLDGIRLPQMGATLLPTLIIQLLRNFDDPYNYFADVLYTSGCYDRPLEMFLHVLRFHNYYLALQKLGLCMHAARQFIV